MMWNKTQYIQNDMTDYPNNAFFFWYDPDQTWIWDIAYIWGDMQPGDVTQLFAPAIVSDTGDITVNANLHGLTNGDTPVLFDSDNNTFLSVIPQPGNETIPANSHKIPVNGQTVPMQKTGAPLALATLGLLGIIGGTLYSRRR